MNLYAAIITCTVRTTKKTQGTLHQQVSQTFRQPVAAISEAEATVQLQHMFPWTFYKHVKIVWELIAEIA
jgi:hypothetical protein